MTSQEIKALTGQYIMNTYGRFPVAIDHGQGATLYDPEGNAYIDFTSGIGVSDLGYGCQPWVDAIAKQAGKIGHTSNLFYTEPPARLAEILCKRTGMSSVFFANGGGEANEGMIKLARKYSFDKYGRGRAAIVTLNNSFHGRTITTLTATGQDVFHNYFFPFTGGFRYADANDLASLEAAAGDDVCAVMMELVQGEGGVLPLDRDYVKAVARLCAEKDWLLLVDEVQTGVGRTGSLFAFQQYGILPDVASFAKGIAGGLPMSGILANEKCRDVLGPGTHATTFGANPVCAAAGLVVQETLTDAVRRCRRGTVVVDTSSSLPAVIQSCAAQAAARGVELIDCPVSGGAEAAAEGRLSAMCGGSETALARVSPLLACFAARVTHMGSLGSGYAAKLINNLIVGGEITLIAEALGLARKAGLDMARLLEALELLINKERQPHPRGNMPL